MEKKIYTLNNIEYELIDTIIDKNTKYLLLMDISNYSNICIRKEVGDFIERLDDEEYNNIIVKFLEKNKNLFE